LQRTSAAAATESISSFGQLPTTEGKEWSSLTESVQFLPASDENSPLLRHAQHRFLSYYSDHFVDGQETEYNEYAQVWRLLGLYIDCNAADNDNAEEQRRRLEDGGEDDNGEDQGEDANEDQGEDANDDQGEEANDDQGDEEEQQQQNEEEQEEVQEEENDGSVCARQLLWAAVSS